MPGTNAPLILLNDLANSFRTTSLSSSGTSNKTFTSKSASSLYVFVSIEPTKLYFKTGRMSLNCLIWLCIISNTPCFNFGLSVSASSNTPLAYVRLGISMTASCINLNIFSSGHSFFCHPFFCNVTLNWII